MQMYAVVATGVLGLLIGFWLGRSIRWNMEETEEEEREGPWQKIRNQEFLTVMILAIEQLCH